MRGKRSRLTTPNERRLSNRLPITEPVRYKIFGQRNRRDQIGSGATVNMSSGGVQFTTESSLMVGSRIELAVSWPVSLNGVALKLVVLGRVVRVENARAAMSIERYEFKTRRSEAPAGVTLAAAG